MKRFHFLRLMSVWVFYLALCLALPFSARAQSFSTGTVTIGTGDDDLRPGSSAFVEFLRGDEVLSQVRLTAERERLADRTSKEVTFRLDAPLDLANVEFVRLYFWADRGTFGDDQWQPSNILVRVNDGSPGGRVLWTARRVPKMNNERRYWRSPTLESFGRTQTRIRFRLSTGNDDLRVDSMALCEVETNDGRVFSKRVLGPLRDRTSKTIEMNLPAGVTSSQIRLVRLYFGPGLPLAFHTPFSAAWQGDQWEVSSFTATATDPDGRVVNLGSSGRIKFERPGWWQSSPRTARRAPVSSTRSFVIFIHTGADDLRTDPNVQPNSELEWRVHLRDGRRLTLDTGRTTRRNFVGQSDTAFFGSFNNWGTAWTVATAPEAVALSDIEAFSATLIRGRGPDAPCGTLQGETLDPFRGDDQWAINGLWIGVVPSSAGDASDGEALSNRAQRILSQWNIGAKLHRNNRTFTTERLELSRPLRLRPKPLLIR